MIVRGILLWPYLRRITGARSKAAETSMADERARTPPLLFRQLQDYRYIALRIIAQWTSWATFRRLPIPPTYLSVPLTPKSPPLGQFSKLPKGKRIHVKSKRQVFVNALLSVNTLASVCLIEPLGTGPRADCGDLSGQVFSTGSASHFRRSPHLGIFPRGGRFPHSH